MGFSLDFLHTVLIYQGSISPQLVFDYHCRYSGEESYALDSTVSMIGASNLMFQEKLSSPLSSITYKNTLIIFEHFNDIFFIVQCIADINENLVRRAITLAHKLLSLQFGPTYLYKSKVSLKRHSSTIKCFINVSLELIFNNVAQLLSATPAPILDATIQRDLESTLKQSCSSLGTSAFHSFLFVDTQLVASLLRSSVRAPPREFSSFVYALTRQKLIEQQPTTFDGHLLGFSDCFVQIDTQFEKYGVALFPLALSTEKPVFMVLLFHPEERNVVKKSASTFYLQAKKHLDLLICLALVFDRRSASLPSSREFPGLCSFVSVNRSSEASVSTLHQGCGMTEANSSVTSQQTNKFLSLLRKQMTNWIAHCQECLITDDTCILVDRSTRFVFYFRIWFWVQSSGCVIDVPLPEKKTSSTDVVNFGNVYESLLKRIKYRKVNITEVFAVFLSPLSFDEVMLCGDALRDFIFSNFYMNNR
ncbi:hypothetical protein GEMRC1_007481 [Eukaryota sp. GEM-RC1]